MKPLVCPQCGGKITDYSPLENFAVCEYCSTQFVIEPEKQAAASASPTADDSPTAEESLDPYDPLGKIACAFLLIFFVIGVVVSNNNWSRQTYSSPDLLKYMPADPVAAPPAKANLLEFGGTGAGDGLFQNASALAVDARGRIYVGDESLRVQQFNEQGRLLKFWRIPAQTYFFKFARGIKKIAVDETDALYVLVDGTLLIYGTDDSGTPATLKPASNASIEDFVLRPDGTILLVSRDKTIEKLDFFDNKRKLRRSVKGFYSNAVAGLTLPRKTGLGAIRSAVNGAGNIYSIYALDNPNDYLRYNNQVNLLISRFTPEGKFVDEILPTKDSRGIEFDNQGRVYLSHSDPVAQTDVINVFSITNISAETIGKTPLVQEVATVGNLPRVKAFALDRQNNIYILSGDKVFKRSAIK